MAVALICFLQNGCHSYVGLGGVKQSMTVLINNDNETNPKNAVSPQFSVLYLVSLVVILIGFITFNAVPTPEPSTSSSSSICEEDSNDDTSVTTEEEIMKQEVCVTNEREEEEKRSRENEEEVRKRKKTEASGSGEDDDDVVSVGHSTKM